MDTSQSNRGTRRHHFPYPIDDTRSILMGANKALKKTFKNGYPYAKAGILLSHFSHPTFIQQSLFTLKIINFFS